MTVWLARLLAILHSTTGMSVTIALYTNFYSFLYVRIPFTNDQLFFCKRHESYTLNLFCFGYTLPISIYIKKYLETGETVHRNSGNCEKHGHDMMYNRTCTFTYYYNYLFRLCAKAEDDMAWPLRYLLTSKSFLLSAFILF